jgi:hypothetical protein
VTPLETLIAETAAEWQTRVAVVCEHTQVISYGQLAETLAPKIREHIATEIEANSERVDPIGDFDPFGETLQQCVRFVRGGQAVTPNAVLRPADLAELLDYVAGRGDVRVVQEETLNRAFAALKATVRSEP